MVPVLETLGLVILTAVPTRIPGFAELAPCWPLIGIFYWSIYRPDLLSALSAFLLGTLLDFVGGTPLGVNTLIFLLVRSTVVVQRRFFLGHSFVMTWASFAMIATAAMGLQWMLFGFISGQGMDPRNLMWQYVFVVGVFPILTVVLAYTQTIFLRDH